MAARPLPLDVRLMTLTTSALGWALVALVLAGWNTLLARYNYAAGDTRLPFVCETSGNLAQAVTLPLLAWLYGAQGMAMALLHDARFLRDSHAAQHAQATWQRMLASYRT